MADGREAAVNVQRLTARGAVRARDERAAVQAPRTFGCCAARPRVTGMRLDCMRDDGAGNRVRGRFALTRHCAGRIAIRSPRNEPTHQPLPTSIATVPALKPSRVGAIEHLADRERLRVDLHDLPMLRIRARALPDREQRAVARPVDVVDAEAERDLVALRLASRRARTGRTTGCPTRRCRASCRRRESSTPFAPAASLPGTFCQPPPGCHSQSSPFFSPAHHLLQRVGAAPRGRKFVVTKPPSGRPRTEFRPIGSGAIDAADPRDVAASRHACRRRRPRSTRARRDRPRTARWIGRSARLERTSRAS